MKKIVFIDNYDSFTYNLVHLVKKEINTPIKVFRNDEISVGDIDPYDIIIISPGPGLPCESGILLNLIDEYKKTKSIFGVCLGMQAIAEVFGATLYNLDKPLHGISTGIYHTGSKLFSGLPKTFEVGRYHSWAVEEAEIPSELRITARDEKGIVLAIEHETYNIAGVQFHPESILTQFGGDIMRNFLSGIK